jgi:hypothetical protein
VFHDNRWFEDYGQETVGRLALVDSSDYDIHLANQKDSSEFKDSPRCNKKDSDFITTKFRYIE